MDWIRMARTPSGAALDLNQPHNLTAQTIERLTCPAGKSQAFLRDSHGNGLRVRVTTAGAKSFVFEGKLNRKTIRRTIGLVSAWPIPKAREEARRLQRMLDKGNDPRQVERDERAAAAAAQAIKEAEARRGTVTSAQVWAEYVREGTEIGFTKRGRWSERHVADHTALADGGGRPFKRGTGKTAAGPLHALLARPLVQLDSNAIELWLREQGGVRPARTALAFRLLRAFLNWCAEHPVYSQIAPSASHAPKTVRRLVRNQVPKQDALQKEQLADWFAAVRADPDPVASAFLQTLLLTGLRRQHAATLKWSDVDLRYGSLTVHDKIEPLRVIPCPPYLAQTLAALPRDCEWVFGPSAPQLMPARATYKHRRALRSAGLAHISLHGLRRSFGSLAEWVECPTGVVAQIQGHKPSATAEKHYRVRPLDLLRKWHSKIEAWILDEAQIPFAPQDGHRPLSLVA